MTSLIRKNVLPLILVLLGNMQGLKAGAQTVLGPTAPLQIVFNNTVGVKPLSIQDEYINSSGETFRITSLRYFISNIKLRTADGGYYVVPQDSSYFLVTQEDSSSRVISLNVPLGDYTSVEYLLGIDSLRNTLPVAARTGVLDPSSSMDNGMYWSWNSGYIFFRMEGNSAVIPMDNKGQRKFRYHIGGFGGYSAPTINNIKEIKLSLPKAIHVSNNEAKPTRILIGADLLKVFEGSERVSIAAHSNVMFSQYSVVIANNYSAIFSLLRTEN